MVLKPWAIEHGIVLQSITAAHESRKSQYERTQSSFICPGSQGFPHPQRSMPFLQCRDLVMLQDPTSHARALADLAHLRICGDVFGKLCTYGAMVLCVRLQSL